MDEFSLSDPKLGHPMSKLSKLKKIIFYVFGAIIFLVFFYFLFFSAPGDFPTGTIIKIEQGNSLRSVSLQLKNENIIRSSLVFEALVIIYGGEKHIRYSNYFFENKLPVYEIARRISKGEHHMPLISVTIPEGFDAVQIGNIFAFKLVNFNKNEFLLKAKKLEGYLFPDTYFFFTTDNEQDVLQSMSENFDKKTKIILSEIISVGKTINKTEREIIIMASIIEREARGESDREFISGILWKRLAIGMPLQVDVVPNTYKTKGLPQNPISNPGIKSIEAAIYPKVSSYFYYLHDKNGNIYYAKSFSEHQMNIKKYLSH